MMAKMVTVTEREALGKVNFVVMVSMVVVVVVVTERKALGEVHISHGRGGSCYQHDHHGDHSKNQLNSYHEPDTSLLYARRAS
jgi:hypothetical protein